jgi:hypothetical protein
MGIIEEYWSGIMDRLRLEADVLALRKPLKGDGRLRDITLHILRIVLGCKGHKITR